MFHIRQATLKDLSTIHTIEGICFPPAEAASINSLKERLTAYSKGFFVLIEDDRIIGFINVGCTDENNIHDSFYSTMAFHNNHAANLVVFGLDVHPDYQRKGYARKLMQHLIAFGKQENKAKILLSCKEHFIDFYKSFGYENCGLSSSSHGGAKWYDMELRL